MNLKKHSEIKIRNSPEAIWDFAQDPENWTASNPEEHEGLKFYNPKNRPETGIDFHQKERVAGFYADLKGQVLYAERPWVCAWTGMARYKILGGLLHVRIPEGGLKDFLVVPKFRFGEIFCLFLPVGGHSPDVLRPGRALLL